MPADSGNHDTFISDSFGSHVSQGGGRILSIEIVSLELP